MLPSSFFFFFPCKIAGGRSFLTGRIFQEIFRRAGSKIFLGNIYPVHDLKISDRLLRSKSFFKSDSWFYMRRWRHMVLGAGHVSNLYSSGSSAVWGLRCVRVRHTAAVHLCIVDSV